MLTDSLIISISNCPGEEILLEVASYVVDVDGGM